MRPFGKKILTAAIGMSLFASACEQVPRYQYLNDDFSGVIVQIPDTWVELDVGDVLAVPADRLPEGDTAALSRWIVGFAGNRSVKADGLLQPTAQVPTGVVRSRFVVNSEFQQRETTIDVLMAKMNDLGFLPPGGEIIERENSGFVSDAGPNGIVVKTRARYGEGEMVYYYVFSVDPVKSLLSTMLIGCSAECYETHQDQIDSVARSFRVVNPV
jgi:hypothetical protein